MSGSGASGCLLDKVGLICTFIVGVQLFRWLWRIVYDNFVSVALGLNAVNLKQMGKWAVHYLRPTVLNAYVDMNCYRSFRWYGKAYAEHLAKKGLNVVLISRTKSKLDDVAKDLEKKYNVETKTIAVDFTDTRSIYHDIDKQLTGLEIGVLINNVGMSYSHPEYFLENKDKDHLYDDLIACNVYSVTNMCRIVMPGMTERRKGVVVNISSTAAQIPSPMLTVYAATKSYVVKFSEDLATEYARYGITVQCLLPGYVVTNMSRIRSSTWMAPTPLKFVAEAMKTIGVRERTTGYFPHTLLLGFVNFIDGISPSFSRWLITRTMMNIRARALRKSVKS
nr:unnamed protein product [Callosobruchus chinensis]